ncbi:MAG: hypothetical protein HONBIEJF_02496 [Fimbriimonadaceae bacterium]|nr:hypothetical protein [Fimbriimonadaceae bacterium]
MKTANRFFSTLSLLLLVACSWADAFTVKDLEGMVRELEAVLPKDPNLKYPIKCSVETDKEVNAYASIEKSKDGEKPQAIMVVFTGLVEYFKGDKDIIRAVVAHEVAHLSSGHLSGLVFTVKDLDNLFTRQQEFEADVVGASALQRLGRSKADMVKVLLGLEALRGRTGSFWGRICGDHADPKARAAEVAEDPRVLRSLMAFDVGLAFAESRRWYMAGQFFDKAIAQEPKLVEAHINSAQCSLNYYYDLLSFKVRESWLRPDFGPVLNTPTAPVKDDGKVTDADRARYARAGDKLAAAAKLAGGNPKLAELMALHQVLEPDAKPDVVGAGAEALAKLAAAEKDEATMLRYVNNAAVGFGRLSQYGRAYTLLLDSQKQTKLFNYAAGENLGRLTVSDRNKDDEALAADVMYTWLIRATKTAPYYDVVYKAYQESVKKLGGTLKEPTPMPVMLCQAASVFLNGYEIGLFLEMADVEKSLGAPGNRLVFDPKFPDMAEVSWNSGGFRVLTERGQVMRVTSYEPGSFIFLQLRDKSVSGGYSIKVGMTEDELKKLVDLASGIDVKLVRGSAPETWKYWPNLQMGVRIESGKVVAVTASPVRLD